MFLPVWKFGNQFLVEHLLINSLPIKKNQILVEIFLPQQSDYMVGHFFIDVSDYVVGEN